MAVFAGSLYVKRSTEMR